MLETQNDTLIWEAMQLGPLWVMRETQEELRALASAEEPPVPSVTPTPSLPESIRPELPKMASSTRSQSRSLASPPSGPTSSPTAVVQTVEKTSAITPEMIQRASWEELLTYMTTCPLMQLSRTERPVVVGQGSLTPKLMIIGHTLSADDERQGKPMQGVPGRLLDNILARLGLSREEGVYITTLFKTRLDPGLPPTPSQLTQMKAVLMRQIECLKPQYIWMMSPTVVETLLVTNPAWGWQGEQSIGGVHYGVLSTPNLQGYLSQPLDQKGLWQQLIPIKKAIQSTTTP